METRAIAQQFRKPVGDIGRDVALCMAAANAEDYALVLDAVAPQPGESLLEIGMALGAFSTSLIDGGVAYTGLDHSDLMVGLARKVERRGVFLCGDVCEPIAPGGFDCAVAVNTIQWWRNLGGGLRNIHTALLDGGRVAIGLTVNVGIEDFGQQYYSEDELLESLISAGFATSVTCIDTPRRPYLVAVGAKT